MDYTNYTVEDFITDEYFIRWVESSSVEVNAFWESWIQQHPEKRALVEEARRILVLMDFEKKGIAKEKIEDILAKIHENIAQTEAASTQKNPAPIFIQKQAKDKTNKSLFYSWQRMAAVFIGILLLAAAYFLANRTDKLVKYQTAYGETRSIVLPDQSTITLNANSSIAFASGWDSNEVREVWVNGEAFFSVTHKTNHQKFKVHASNLKVEVLGTEFNVNNRRGTAKVVLSSGKVKLSADSQAEAVIMAPGDLVEFSDADARFTRKKVDTEDYTSWLSNKLVFMATPLHKVAQTLEDTYGVKIIFNAPGTGNYKFTGSIPIEEMDVLIQSITASFDLKVVRNGNTIQFIK
jgi:ferric-dicitrate binding protein FerR (iron transport regulator)